MAIQLSDSVRNARLDTIETIVSTSPILRIRSLGVPGSVGAADSGVAICSMTLPSDWMNAATGGSKTLLGSWTNSAVSSGVAAHFRLYASNGTTAHCQGTVGQGSGDLSLDNTSIAAGQTITITTFTLTDGNA